MPVMSPGVNPSSVQSAAPSPVEKSPTKAGAGAVARTWSRSRRSSSLPIPSP